MARRVGGAVLMAAVLTGASAMLVGARADGVSLNIAQNFPAGYQTVNIVDPNQGIGNYDWSGNLNPMSVDAGGLSPAGYAPAGFTAVTGSMFWCTDLNDPAYSGTTSYNIGALTDASDTNNTYVNTNVPSDTATTKLDQATSLIANGQDYIAQQSSGSTAQKVASAAVQVALWSILYQGVTSSYDVTDGGNDLSVSGNSAVTNLANAFLGCLFGGVNGTCSSQWTTPTGDTLQQYEPSGSYQTFALLVGPNNIQHQGGGSSVPEPMSMALLASGLAGLGWVRRRRG